jgi:hypothetical protein
VPVVIGAAVDVGHGAGHRDSRLLGCLYVWSPFPPYQRARLESGEVVGRMSERRKLTRMEKRIIDHAMSQGAVCAQLPAAAICIAQASHGASIA